MNKKIESSNKYTNMQRDDYNRRASSFTGKENDRIVGNYQSHNEWQPYERMLEGFNTKEMKCLDFGCGPGRNILKYGGVFKKIDGVDISKTALEKAEKWITENDYEKDYDLILCNGIDLSEVPDQSYDLIHSTITLQHICVYEIRYNYLSEFYRVLKEGGWVSLQMGYNDSPTSQWEKVNKRMKLGENLHAYYENFYSARGTNGRSDVYVSDPIQLQKDLEELGFQEFSYFITDSPHPETNLHPKQIYFRAKK